MKIVVKYDNLNKNYPIISIDKAAYLSEYKIIINFNDGTVKIVAFELFLRKSLHPSMSKYLDVEVFKNFEITDGNLNWNDYDLIFPLWELYEGKIF
jgi:hypothetical protein